MYSPREYFLSIFEYLFVNTYALLNVLGFLVIFHAEILFDPHLTQNEMSCSIFGISVIYRLCSEGTTQEVSVPCHSAFFRIGGDYDPFRKERNYCRWKLVLVFSFSAPSKSFCISTPPDSVPPTNRHPPVQTS